MNTTETFETAMYSCGYKIDRIKYTKKSGEVRQLIGTVKIPQKATGNRIQHITW